MPNSARRRVCPPDAPRNASLNSDAVLGSASLDASDVGLLAREFGHPIADDVGPIWRYRTDPSSTAALPPAWGDQDLPLVYVSYGSVLAGAGHVNTLYAETLEALAEQPIRVLMTTGTAFDLDALGSVPANARVERWWPQADVMPAASAMIGHGGFGTTMMALAAGVPQVIVPLFAADQHQHAVQVAAVGAGVRLSGYEALADLPAALTHCAERARLRCPGRCDRRRDRRPARSEYRTVAPRIRSPTRIRVAENSAARLNPRDG